MTCPSTEYNICTYMFAPLFICWDHLQYNNHDLFWTQNILPWEGVLTWHSHGSLISKSAYVYRIILSEYQPAVAYSGL